MNSKTTSLWGGGGKPFDYIPASVSPPRFTSVTIPAIRTVVTVEGMDTRENQIEALRVLSAGNTLIIVLLGGVLALQVHENGICVVESGAQITRFPLFLRCSSRAQEARRTLETRELAKMAAEETKEKEGVKKGAL